VVVIWSGVSAPAAAARAAASCNSYKRDGASCAGGSASFTTVRLV
jgi:hypothetical protein